MISCLPHFGHANLTPPGVFASGVLHVMHFMSLSVGLPFKNLLAFSACTGIALLRRTAEKDLNMRVPGLVPRRGGHASENRIPKAF